MAHPHVSAYKRFVNRQILFGVLLTAIFAGVTTYFGADLIDDRGGWAWVFGAGFALAALISLAVTCRWIRKRVNAASAGKECDAKVTLTLTGAATARDGNTLFRELYTTVATSKFSTIRAGDQVTLSSPVRAVPDRIGVNLDATVIGGSATKPMLAVRTARTADWFVAQALVTAQKFALEKPAS